MDDLVTPAILILLGYVLGSIPTGYLAGRLFKGIDVRQVGSGSTGATNVLRAVGKEAAFLVLVVDIGKGWLPVFIADRISQSGSHHYLLGPLAALACVIGHSKSMFLGFKGGKSAATGLGTILGLQWVAGVGTFAVWLLILRITRIVSVASLAAVASCAIFMAALHAPTSYVGYCLIASAYVAFRHRSNVKRLLAGVEPRLGEKSPADPDHGEGREESKPV